MPQNGLVAENVYVQDEDDAEEEQMQTGAYDNSTASGQIMAISANEIDDEDYDEYSSEAIKEHNDDADSEEESVEESDSENSGEIQDVKSITKAMEADFGQMRMVQLASAIAGDLGMVVKVRYAG